MEVISTADDAVPKAKSRAKTPRLEGTGQCFDSR